MSRTYRKHAIRPDESNKQKEGLRQRPLKSNKQRRPRERSALRREYL